MQIKLSDHFTTGKLIKFTIPTIIMMIFTSIYGIVDGIFVSNCVGSDSFAAVNLIMPVLMIMGSTGFMIGTGGSALVSMTLGEGKKEEANRYFSMLHYMLITVAAVLTIGAELLAKPLSAIFVSYDAELLTMTTRAVQLYSLSYLICWFNIWGSGFFTALNNGLISGLISFLRTFLFQVAMIYLLPVFFKLDGIWLAIVAAEILALVVTVVCFVGNRKKYRYY